MEINRKEILRPVRRGFYFRTAAGLLTIVFFDLLEKKIPLLKYFPPLGLTFVIASSAFLIMESTVEMEKALKEKEDQEKKGDF